MSTDTGFASHGRFFPEPGSILRSRGLRWVAVHTSHSGEVLVLADDRCAAGRPQAIIRSASRFQGLAESRVSVAAPIAELSTQAESPGMVMRKQPVHQASELARAAAILGDGAQLRHAAALARLSLEAAAAAADVLAMRGIFKPGTPLRFVDQFAQAAAYRDIPAAVRGLRHGDAARLLAAEGADLDNVCRHLLASEPTGSSEVLARLQKASAQALARGSVDLASRYLARALRETGDIRVRCTLLHKLGRATRVTRGRQAGEQLQEALRLADHPDDKLAIAADLSEVLAFAGEREGARKVIVEARPESGASARGERAGHTAAITTLTARLEAYDTKRVDAFDRRLPTLLADARRTSDPSLCGVLAGVLAWRGQEGVARALLRCALEELQSGAWDEAQALPLSQALFAAIALDEPECVRVLTDQLRGISRSCGSVAALALAATHRAALRARCGELAGAGSDLLTLIELQRKHAISLLLPLAFCLGVDAVIERPELDQAVVSITAGPSDAAGDETVEGAMLHELRGRLALARVNLADARLELERAGDTYQILGLYGPNASSWRSALALALAGQNDQRAFSLAAAELEDARRLGSPRAIGVALRTVGLLEAGTRAINYLQEATAILEPTCARLEHGRALIDLGAALRRANHRSAARGPLRAGLELAERCGARRLKERALVELRATGARPRRAALSGSAALTTAERRTAELASRGMTNPEIARTLFVTVNTVEGHLRHVYQKLSIHSRQQLREALEDQTLVAGGGLSLAATPPEASCRAS